MDKPLDSASPDRPGVQSGKPEPQETLCPECGSRIRFKFLDNPLLLGMAEKDPHWIKLPCEVCEQEKKKEKLGRKRRKSIDTALENSRLKKRFIGKTFDNFVPYGKEKNKQREILFIAREFAENFSHHRDIGTWMLFTGNVGTGKGHLCAAIINKIIRSGFTALFTKTPSLLREIKETYDKQSETSEKEIFAKFKKIDLLVIDEIGVQFGTNTEKNIIFEILDARYEDMQPTILTTNIRNPKTMEALLGQSILDRFYEGESKIITFDWGSFRREAKGFVSGGPKTLAAHSPSSVQGGVSRPGST